MFAKLRTLERRIKCTLDKLKNDNSKLKTLKSNWKNLPDKTALNDNFSNFVKSKMNELNLMFDKIYE